MAGRERKGKGLFKEGVMIVGLRWKLRGELLFDRATRYERERERERER